MVVRRIYISSSFSSGKKLFCWVALTRFNAICIVSTVWFVLNSKRLKQRCFLKITNSLTDGIFVQLFGSFGGKGICFIWWTVFLSSTWGNLRLPEALFCQHTKRTCGKCFKQGTLNIPVITTLATLFHDCLQELSKERGMVAILYSW